jgi:TonB family protein
MTTSDLIRELLQATLATSAAMVLLLPMRRPLRARFGARLAYLAWLLVPVAMLAVWLPARTAALAGTGEGASVLSAPIALVDAAVSTASTNWQDAVTVAWALGGLALLAWFALCQRNFTRRLSRRDGDAFDRVEGEGPALVGWWRPRIVLPTDFRERYTRGERRLVLAHEISHLRNGDIHAQALASALRCLFWFNPLVHLAAAAFRFDQELACDARVLEKFPRGRSRYGSAMLKTQLAVTGLPVGCHWQSSHAIKERIQMLKKPLPARTRKLAGSFLVAMIVGCGTWAAWAAQPTQPVRPVAKAPAPTSARKSDAPQITRITDRDQMTSPVYPAGVTAEGNVEIELHVGADGKVKDVKILKSEPAGVFDQATIDAAMKWKVTPPMKNGVPVEGRFRTVVEYRQDPPKPGAKS